MNRSAKGDHGLCYDCHLPAAPGRARCPDHLASSALATKRYLLTPGGQASLVRKKPYLAKWHHTNRRGDGRFKYVARHAKRRGLEWALNEAEYEDLWTAPCFYCGQMNDVAAGVGLDRLDNTKGYLPGNVVSCCYLCNVTRADRFTVGEMLLLGKVIAEIRRARVPIL